MNEPLDVNGQLIVPASDMEWAAVRASGAGGQNVNKVSSKVELRFLLGQTQALDEEVLRRLKIIAKRRISSDGHLIVTSQRFRDQPRNLLDAREKLKNLIVQALEKPKPRKPTRPSKGAREDRLHEKKALSQKKESRRKDHSSDY